MSNKKYLKEGVNEVVTVLGAYKKENKELYKELKISKKQLKRTEKYLNKYALEAEEKHNQDLLEKVELIKSIDTLKQILKRASNGLSTDKLINTEKLLSKEVKDVLDNALVALEEEDTPKKEIRCNCATPSFFMP